MTLLGDTLLVLDCRGQKVEARVSVERAEPSKDKVKQVLTIEDDLANSLELKAEETVTSHQ